ncbi:hypothetical protein MN608_00481 [Microdochium nivale]|nr:hypothetical protein MN608_00481 [Microdochium nivale]
MLRSRFQLCRRICRCHEAHSLKARVVLSTRTLQVPIINHDPGSSQTQPGGGTPTAASSINPATILICKNDHRICTEGSSPERQVENYQ